MNLVLDAGVLSRLCHPNPTQAASIWIRIEQLRTMHPGASFYIPEIADFEVRRKLLHMHKKHSLAHLDKLGETFTYLCIDTPTMRRAAAIWADARRHGHPSAGESRLDADVILAAQALGVGGTVATTNVRHLSHYVAVEDWT